MCCEFRRKWVRRVVFCCLVDRVGRRVGSWKVSGCRESGDVGGLGYYVSSGCIPGYDGDVLEEITDAGVEIG